MKMQTNGKKVIDHSGARFDLRTVYGRIHQQGGQGLEGAQNDIPAKSDSKGQQIIQADPGGNEPANSKKSLD